MEWIKTTLKEISTDVSYGYTASAQADECGPKFLRITDIVPYFVDYNSVPYCKIDKNKCKQYLLEKGDLIIARTGATTGYNYLFEDDIPTVFASYLIRFRLSKTKVVPKLIKYIVKTDNYFSFINNHISGAAQPGINAPTLGNYSFLIPKELKYQQKIAKILSNYDDLIENNNKRIKILEEMAQKIYKEWFVDFKFPGYETTTFKQTELGKIPSDWEVKQIGKEYKTYLGGTPSRNEEKYWNGNIPWLNSGKTNELRIIEASEYITEFGLVKSSTKLMPQYTTVLAITGATLGQVSMLGNEMCANQSVVGIYSDTTPEYVYYLMNDKIQKLVQSASGGAQQHINKDIVNEMKFVLPANNILADFKDIMEPINLNIFNLLNKNQTLKQTRDILLSRLISGEIDVEKLEIK